MTSTISFILIESGSRNLKHGDSLMHHRLTLIMAPDRFVTVNCADLLLHKGSPSSTDFISGPAMKDDWGSLQVSRFAGPRFTMTVLDGVLSQNLHISECSENERSTFNAWFSFSGRIKSVFNDTRTHLQVGDGSHAYFYKPRVNDDHYLFSSDDAFKLINVSVDKNLLLDVLCDHESWSCDLKERLLRKQEFVGSSTNGSMTPRMHAILLDVMNCPLTGSLKRMLIEAKVLELIAYQLQHFHANDQPCRTILSTIEKECFLELRKFLDTNYQQEHSLQSLSRAFCLNEFKLKKGFKELFGTTVFSYIHSLRMQQARTMIADEKLSINVVAGKVGYKNPNHFSAAFKKQFGVSPSLIR